MLFFMIVFNAFVITGMIFFGGVVLEYSSYLNAVMSQFEFLLGKAIPMDAIRRDKPFVGPSFSFLFCIFTNIFPMNILLSIFNESYVTQNQRQRKMQKSLKWHVLLRSV